MKIRLGLVGILTILLSSFSFGQELQGSDVEGVLEQEAGVFNEAGTSETVFLGDNDAKTDFDKKIANRSVNIEKRSKVRVKDIFKVIKKVKKSAGGLDLMTILLIILAIILPPLAVAIFEGITGRFWLVLICWLLGIGLLAWLLPAFFYLGWIVAIILALLIVLGVW